MGARAMTDETAVQVPHTEEEILDYGFKAALGRLILEREKQGRVMIADLDMPLLERFFKAGYCFAPAVQSDRAEIRALEDEIERCPAVGYHTQECRD